eukprot:gb/GECH01014802.1/.p1 GENE.gb/GECH01014802.1/~~gb/GECH01014802.1/.p1  ORF type:complete len:599 (+),score=157.21 gb/GECH01014802.1/:1-1797(+)
MTSALNLDTILKLSALRESSRKEFLNALDGLRGSKALILDEQLIGPLNVIFPSALLKEHGVEDMFQLSSVVAQTKCKHMIYIIRPQVQLMKTLADHIRSVRYGGEGEGDKGDESTEFSVYMVPRKTLICERVLEEEGVFGDIRLCEYSLDLIPFDNDVLSMELPQAFREVNLDGDMSALFHTAKALLKLQSMFGLIPHVKAKGAAAKQVYDIMGRLRQAAGNKTFPTSPEISDLILIDRNVDLLTPLLTQLTYEGLIDELFGIKHGLLPAASNPNPPTNKDGKPMPVMMNSNDKVFAEVRDLNFSAVGSRLNNKTTELGENYDQRFNAQTAAQMKEFIRRLPHLQEEHKNLGTHINLAHDINKITLKSDFRRCIETEQYTLMGVEEKENLDFIEEIIDKQESMTKALRLLGIVSLTQGGLKQKQFDFFRKELMQSYGYESMLTLNNLERIGFLKRQESRSNWKSLRKHLNLQVEELDEQNPNDISYVHAGYAPLSVRLIEQALFKPGGWKAIDDTLRTLPGPVVDTNQPGAIPPQSNKRIVLLFFLGGVTFAEISAIRFLNTIYQEAEIEFVIGTTQLMNGHTFVESMYERVGALAKK